MPPVVSRLLFVVFAGLSAAAVASTVGGCQETQPAVVGCRASDCGLHGVCVAGRCQVMNADAGAAIDAPGVKRIVIPASELAFLREGSDANAVPPVLHLGRAADRGSMLLARFPYPYAQLGKIVEAYVLLPRSSGGSATDDPGVISLHAARIVSTWSGGSTTWSSRPQIDDVGTVVTKVRAEEADLARIVRLDVRFIVERFRSHDPSDQGIAVLADDHSVSGLSFATPASDDASSLPAGALPALELYVAPE